MIYCSLVIPCYNESKNIPLILEKCKVLLEVGSIEVILVDNGSSEDTSEVLANLLPKYPGCHSVVVDRNQGYGYGILKGLQFAKGEILAWTHADMQTDPQDIILGLDIFRLHGLDIFVKGLRYGRPFFDVFFTVGMSVFESILLRQKMWDINAQPTMFSRKFLQTWSSPPKDFSLDLYVYYQAQIQGLNIFRFPVKFRDRSNGVSSWNVSFLAKLKFIRRTLSYSFQLKKNI